MQIEYKPEGTKKWEVNFPPTVNRKTIKFDSRKF